VRAAYFGGGWTLAAAKRISAALDRLDARRRRLAAAGMADYARPGARKTARCGDRGVAGANSGGRRPSENTDLKNMALEFANPNACPHHENHEGAKYGLIGAMGIVAKILGSERRKAAPPTTEAAIADAEGALQRLGAERLLAEQEQAALESERRKLLLVDGSENRIKAIDAERADIALRQDRIEALFPHLTATLSNCRATLRDEPSASDSSSPTV
jgi:hypothetical protein